MGIATPANKLSYGNLPRLLLAQPRARPGRQGSTSPGRSDSGEGRSATTDETSTNHLDVENATHTKDPSRLDSNDVQRKAAEMWCKQRRMEYVVATVG